MTTLNYRQIPAALSVLGEFHGNSMRGERVANISWLSGARLSGEDLAALKATDESGYVVFSYDTPIAWVTDSGVKHIVAQKFSVTTSRQQTLVRAYL